MVSVSNGEPWYASRVTWGYLVTAVSALAGLFGYALAPDTQALLVGAGSSVGALLGAAITHYGRWRATRPLEPEDAGMALDLTFNLATFVTVELAMLTGSLWVGGLNTRVKQLEAELARKDAGAAQEAKDSRLSHDALNAECNLLREQLNEYKLRVADTMVSAEQLREVRAEFRQSLGEVRSKVNRLPDAIMDRMTQVLPCTSPGAAARRGGPETTWACGRNDTLA